jgi:hypothetical protein
MHVTVHPSLGGDGSGGDLAGVWSKGGGGGDAEPQLAPSTGQVEVFELVVG